MNLKSALLIILISFLLPGCSLFKKPPQDNEPVAKEPIIAPVNVIAVDERPFVTLTPTTDGRRLNLSVEKLNKPATEVEYDLEYETGTMLQGAFGSFMLDTIPATADILLGSCSAGGACSYFDNITGGQITLKFRGQENYAVRSEWRFFETDRADGVFSSKDAKITVEANKSLDRNKVVVVSQTSGLPAEAPGELIAGPYGLFANNTSIGEKLVISLRLSQDATDVTIYGYNQGEWQAYETKIKDKTATASVDYHSVYIAVKN